MAIKYYIEYNDVIDITHRLEIYDDAFSGSVTEINGTIFLDYSENDDVNATIKGLGLRVELEANSTLTFSDLYSEYEKDFSIIYKRDSVVKFNGWINPEGWYEDFVLDKWKITFDCIDGLSFLEYLSYVDDSTGLTFTGLQSVLEIISNCLIRTGVQQEIRTDVSLVYDGLTETLDVLDNAHFDSVRFVKDDGDTIMSCNDVLKSTLELLGATVTSIDGYWYIYRTNQLYSSSTITYFGYSYLGVPTTNGTVNVAVSLGGNIDGFYPHHCNANQSIRNEKSIGAYRINYKYGIKKGLLDNIYFDSDGTTIDEWTKDSAIGFLIPASHKGFQLTYNVAFASLRKIYSDNIALSLDDKINLFLKYELDFISGGSGITDEYLVAKIILVGTTTYYYNGGSWGTTNVFTKEKIAKVNGVYTLDYDLTIPIDGDLRIEFWTPEGDSGVATEFMLYFTKIVITPFEDQGDNLEGEFHTLQRTVNVNSKIEDVKEVFNGDNDSSIYVGAIYENDEVTLTSTWKRKSITEDMGLLEMMGRETMRLNQNTKRIFSGSIYGYYSYLSLITIDGLAGKYIPTKYSYNTKENIIESEFKQIFGDDLVDIDYVLTFDYGQVVTPTIIG